MATLTGQAINASYQGILKTLDNAAISGTNRVISDGLGNALPLEASTTTIKFTGNADFTSATVTGIAAGMINGSGTDSIESSDTLTTNAANASGDTSIAIGDGAVASGDSNVGIGTSVNSGGSYATAVGREASVTAAQGTAIGFAANVTAGSGVALGRIARSFDTDAIGIGNTATANNLRSISIGSNSSTTADDAGAIGAFVTGGIANTISMKAIELQTDSTPTAGGIIMSDAGGTDRRINIDATGGLQIDSTPVGGGGAAGLINGSGTDSLESSDTLTSSAANASGNKGIAIGNGALASGGESIAIGDEAQSTSVGCASVGQYSEASGIYASAWGRTAYARADGAVAFGQQAGVPTGVAGGVAMGRQVVADLNDTTHVRALKIVAPDGGTGGNGINMLSPDGTEYKLTVSNAGALVITAV